MGEILLPVFDSLVFDLDGTLWDASPTCTQAWNHVLRESGYTQHLLDETAIRSFSGKKVETVFEQHFHFIPANKRSELLEAYKKQETLLMKALGGQLYPGVKETLAELKKSYKLFVVSNCLTGYIENFIHFTRLEGVFQDFDCSGNTGLTKGENIQAIIERNNLKQAVYIGDTKWDWEAARNCSITFIWAAYGFGQVPEASYKIDAFRELKDLISTTKN